MGFANIWATKAECNGKGQRRWCVPPAPPAGRPCAEPAFFSDDGRLRPIAPLRHASAPARDFGRDRIRGTDSPRRARLSGGWDAARRRGSAQRGRMRSLGFHPCITSTCERHPSLTSASPRPPPQPRVREPVGYHSQVQPEHLQAVLPRVRQGHRLREGAPPSPCPQRTAPLFSRAYAPTAPAPSPPHGPRLFARGGRSRPPEPQPRRGSAIARHIS